MKTLVFIILAMGFIYFIYIETGQKKQTSPTSQTIIVNKPDLNILFGQDVSQSILSNGIVLISSDVFNPYFEETERNINLYFGVISSASAGELIHGHFPAIHFKRPELPNLNSTALVTRRNLKTQYEREQQQYYKDSIAFFLEREKKVLQNSA